MSAFRGNFVEDDDQEYSRSSDLPQQDVPITGSLPYWTDGAHQSFVPDALNITSMPTTIHDVRFTGHVDPYYGGVHPQPFFYPGDNFEGLGMERVEFPGSHSYPPLLAQSSFIDPGELRPISIPPSQPNTTPMYDGHPERNVVTYTPFITATSSMQPLGNNDPVPVPSSTPGPRGEQWDLPGADSYRCLWISEGKLCSAPIEGDRKIVTGHLRDEHNFTCDNRIVECAWDHCTTSMQRRNIPRHIVACHLRIKVPCQRCGLPLSRADANKKHMQACTGTSPPAAMGASEMDPSVYFGGVVIE